MRCESLLAAVVGLTATTSEDFVYPLYFLHSFVLVSWNVVKELKHGRVYAQGSVHELMAMKGWRNSQVLYIGDNLLSDSVEPRRLFGCVGEFCFPFSRSPSISTSCRRLIDVPPRWVTGVILRELESHVAIHDSPRVQSIEAVIQCLDSLMRLVQQPAFRDVQASSSHFLTLPVREELQVGRVAVPVYELFPALEWCARCYVFRRSS